MADQKRKPAEAPDGDQVSSLDDSAPGEELGEEDARKGGGDGKTKALGGKGLGDYVKTDKSESAYE